MNFAVRWALALSVVGCGTSGSGDAAGGVASSTGGSTSGGSPNGGNSNGGNAATATGGSTTGGSATGGKAPIATGGSATGGKAATATGGSSSENIDCRKDGDGKTTLSFINHCAQTLTYAGSDIAGGTLTSSSHACVDIGNTTDAISSKRYWGYFGADPGAGKYSLAEFTFNTDFQDFDWYNISYVDAFNVAMQIVPVARSNCKSLTCSADFLSACPAQGQFKDASGAVVACVNPARNDGNNPVAKYFESCDEAYAWSGDDQNGTDPSPVRACAGEDFDIVFCPGAP